MVQSSGHMWTAPTAERATGTELKWDPPGGPGSQAREQTACPNTEAHKPERACPCPWWRDLMQQRTGHNREEMVWVLHHPPADYTEHEIIQSVRGRIKCFTQRNK